ncbi:Nucleoporin p58/p45 [Dissophora ornata]|nr:Nucleoporin p58/p45 [Dissophora ornata]
MSLFQGTPVSTSTPTSTNLFGGATSTAANPSIPFGAIGSATLTTPSLFGASTTASSAAATSTATTTTAPSLSLIPPLLTAAPSTSTGTLAGSLFSTPNATAASNALINAAGRNALSVSSLGTSTTPALTADTIAGSTKYTELPADAKTTLDQFHLFLQGQIHLSTTLTSRPSESLDKISKDTDELSKRLATLNDALDRDTKVIQALQHKVGQELKQADSAGRIIEAYANTSHANFLYAGNNSAGQYFMDQCQSFEEQLRQFRSTIEEIERHLASFGAKHPQASHALPEVMRNQHEGFLAVAGRVATLHDEIKDKEKAYLMFRRKYFDDDSDPFQTTKQRKVDSSQSLRSSSRPSDGLRSFREVAKETLRPGSIKAPAAAPPATAPVGSSFFPPTLAIGSAPTFPPAPSTGFTGFRLGGK